MDPKRLLFYQSNPVKLNNSVKYDYQYKYCIPYIEGKNNSYQNHTKSSCYYLLKNDPYLRKLPDNFSYNLNSLGQRSKMIYLNSTDNNWGPQTINRKLWDQQNKTYNSGDQLLKDKIEKIKYEENKRNNKILKKANPSSLVNGYYNWNNKNNNWYLLNKSSKGKNKMYGNMGVNTDIYNGNSHKIVLNNINKDPIYYNTHSINKGGKIDNNYWYKKKCNYIRTGRSIYDLGISRKY